MRLVVAKMPRDFLALYILLWDRSCYGTCRLVSSAVRHSQSNATLYISCSKKAILIRLFKTILFGFRDVKSRRHSSTCAKVSQQPSAWRSASGLSAPYMTFYPRCARPQRVDSRSTV